MPAINTHWHENRLWRLSFAAPAINTVVPAAWHDDEELQSRPSFLASLELALFKYL